MEVEESADSGLKSALKLRPKYIRSRLGDFISKKVSFGNGKGSLSETYTYERQTSSGSGTERGGRGRQAELSRVQVREASVEAPSAIAPPSQAPPVITLAAHETAARPIGPTIPTVQFSPPLPSLQQDAPENPFRPEGDLHQVVEPIIQLYKQHPFPPGTHEDGQPLTAVDGHQTQAAAPVDAKAAKKAEKEAAKKAAKEAKEAKKAEKSGRKGSKETSDGSGGRPSSLPFSSAQPHTTTLSSPKAGKVELVHLEEKKKKCCSCLC